VTTSDILPSCGPVPLMNMTLNSAECRGIPGADVGDVVPHSAWVRKADRLQKYA
jgi:hypothetical protein